MTPSHAFHRGLDVEGRYFIRYSERGMRDICILLIITILLSLISSFFIFTVKTSKMELKQQIFPSYPSLRYAFTVKLPWNKGEEVLFIHHFILYFHILLLNKERNYQEVKYGYKMINSTLSPLPIHYIMIFTKEIKRYYKRDSPTTVTSAILYPLLH